MEPMNQDLFQDTKVEQKTDFNVNAGTGCSLSLTPYCSVIGGCDTDTDCGL